MLKAKITACKRTPLPNSNRGNTYGYGDKIATTYLVQTIGSKRWRRVWAFCWSNVVTLYVVIGKETHIVDDQDLVGDI